MIKISLRLVPDQQPEEVVAQVERAIAAAAPPGIVAQFQLLSSAPASMVDPEHTLVRKAAQAMERVFGNPTVYVRCGGSISDRGSFAEKLKIPSVMMGFGLPDDNLHAPNEKLSVGNYERGIESMIGFFNLAAADGGF